MKIAIVDPVGCKMGMQHYNDGLLNALAENGYEVFAFSNYQSAFNKILSNKYFDNIDKSGFNALPPGFMGIVKSILYCRRHKMNYVLFHIFKGGLFELFSEFMAWVAGLNVVLILHDIETIDTAPNKFIKRFLLSHFNKTIIVHNKYSLEKLNLLLKYKENKKNISVIPHGNFLHLTNTTFTRESAAAYFQMGSAERYVLFFGQIKKTKGLDVLLEAFHLSNNRFKLIIAGKLRIENFNLYERIIHKYQMQDRVILLLRYLSDEEINMLLALTEAVILPYRIIYQSGVLMRAMSFGKAVIASDLEPFKEIISHGENGLLFTNSNAQSLAGVLNEISSGNFNLNSMGQKAKEYAEKHFSWQAVASQYEKVLP